MLFTLCDNNEKHTYIYTLQFSYALFHQTVNYVKDFHLHNEDLYNQ